MTAHTIDRVTPLTREQRTLAIGLVMGVTLVAFEMTAVITALPTISDELGGESLYGVALAAYTLADVVALVAAGELADRRGPTLPYTLSLCTFVVGLLVAASAPTMGVIVLGRALQGAGDRRPRADRLHPREACLSGGPAGIDVRLPLRGVGVCRASSPPRSADSSPIRPAGAGCSSASCRSRSSLLCSPPGRCAPSAQ